MSAESAKYEPYKFGMEFHQTQKKVEETALQQAQKESGRPLSDYKAKKISRKLTEAAFDTFKKELTEKFPGEDYRYSLNMIQPSSPFFTITLDTRIRGILTGKKDQDHKSKT